MTDDPIRRFLRARGVADHVVAGGLDGLVADWEHTAERVESGYALGLDDYLNDLDARQIIEVVLSAIRSPMVRCSPASGRPTSACAAPPSPPAGAFGVTNRRGIRRPSGATGGTSWSRETPGPSSRANSPTLDSPAPPEARGSGAARDGIGEAFAISLPSRNRRSGDDTTPR